MSELLKEKFFPNILYKILTFLLNGRNKDETVIIGDIKKNFENEISYPVINHTLSLLKVAKLIEKGNGKDRREHIVKLTDKGNELLRALKDIKDLF